MNKKSNTIDYIQKLETIKSKTETNDNFTQTSFDNILNQTIQNKDNNIEENIKNTTPEIQSDSDDIETEEIKSVTSFNDMFSLFYKHQYSKFISSLSSKNTTKFRLSEVSDCLLKIFFSKHIDEIKSRFMNVFNNDNIYYVLNLHAIKGTQTHTYLQNWCKKINPNCEIEKQLELTIDDITLIGRCDIVVNDNPPYIIELKSSSSYSSYHELQLQLQMFMMNKLNQNKNIKIEKSYLWYYFQQKYYTVKYDEKYVTNFINYLKILKSLLNLNISFDDIINTYKKHVQKLGVNRNDICSSCIYKNICFSMIY